MSIAKHYLSIEKADDARAALSFVFLAAGDAIFTAEKRVNENFFLRGRGRSLNTDLYSYVQSVHEVEELDDHVETNITDESLKILNQYIKTRIDLIEFEYESENRVTKNMQGLILDLKSVYSIIISQVQNLDELKDILTPNVDEEPWKTNWDVSHLVSEPLKNFSESEYQPSDKGDSKLINLIRTKVEYDRFKILDDLIEYFKTRNREDLIELIKVSTFKFISDSASNISNTYNLDLDAFNVINKARINYISRTKLDLKYTQELVGINASTYKKRSNKIKLELIDLGEELQTGNSNLMQDYLIN